MTPSVALMNNRRRSDWNVVTTPTIETVGVSERPIDWLIDVLRGSSDAVHVSRRDAPDGNVELERYTIFPTDGDPKLLISARSSKVRSAALRRVGSESTPAMKFLRRIGSELAKTGLDQLATGADIVFSVEAKSVAEAPGDRDPMTIVEYLEASLGVPGLHIAATIGPLRPNRKPVLQVMDADGTLVAFAKVGWDRSTRHMVTREAEVLNGMCDHDLKDVIVPDVLHFGSWRGLCILATEPLDHPDAGVPGEHLVRIGVTEIARHRGITSLALTNSCWFRSAQRRAHHETRIDDDLIQEVQAIAASDGGVTIEFGFSHGDWAPWNMARLGRKLGVWDWERACDEAPLGIDLVHGQFQQAFHRSNQNVAIAARRAESDVAEGLDRLGIPQRHRHLIVSLYLLELTLRYDESALASDPKIRNTRQQLIAELRTRRTNQEHMVQTTTAADPATPRQLKLLGRRMLGGSGVPAPIRETVKGTVKLWGKATADHRTVPNTFIIGAQRCGTTSMFRYLTQHPSVTGPRLEKGVHYFDTNFDNDIDWYRSHFPTVRSARLARQRYGCDLRIVEACPYYSFHPMVPGRIADVVPDPKFVILVRDPVSRALSHHNHEVKRGFEDADFGSAIEVEKDRLNGEIDRLAADETYVSFEHQHHSYVARGKYEEQIAAYEQVFGADRVLTLRSTDLEHDPSTTVTGVLNFLGVPLSTQFNFPRFNARAYDAMDPEIEAQLRDEFAPTDAAMAERFERNEPWT